jgi:cellulose synthase operon protein C
MTTSMRALTSVLALAACMQLSGCDWFVNAQQRIVRAEQHIAAADDRAAFIELQNAVRADSKNVRARLLLAEVSLRLGDPNAARRELASATEAGARPEQTAAPAAEVLLALGEFRPLLAQLDAGESALAEPVLSTYRGLALLGSHDVSAAIDAFNRALAVDPRWARAQIGKAEALARAGNSGAALELLDEALAANPKQALALLLRGTLLARRGEFESASVALHAAGQSAGGQLSVAQHFVALATLAEAQLGLGAIKDAQATYVELTRRAPDAVLTRLVGARIAMARNDYATAVAQAQKAVNAAPRVLSAKMILGAALLARGNVNQALVQLTQVVREAPENVEARKLLAKVHLQLQRPDAALEVLLPAQDAHNGDSQLEALMGWANLQRGDNAAAVAMLERSAADGKGVGSAELASAYLAAGMHEKALEVLKAMPADDPRGNRLLISVVLRTSGPQAARAEVDRLLGARPQDLETINLAALVYAQAGEIGRARQLLDRAQTIDPKHSATLLNLARIEIVSGDLRAAAAAAQRAINLDEADGAARIARSEIALLEGDVLAAIRGLEQVRSNDPGAIQARLLLVRAHLQQGSGREAEAVISELQRLAIDQPAVTSALGRLYIEAGRYDEALGQFHEAVRQDPRNPSYGMDVARTQLAMGNTAAARETLEKLVAAHPQAMIAARELILLDAREGRREAAQGRLAGIKAKHPQDAALAVLEGDLAMAAKSYGPAAQAYAAAFKLSPSGPNAIRTYRARQLGKLPDATGPLLGWLQQRPNDSLARLILAEDYAGSGQLDQAIREYEQVLRDGRPNPGALNNLAWVYHLKGDARAIDTARRAYGAAPGVAAIADTYGWLLVESGRPGEGLPILEKAAAADAPPEVHFHYAVALMKTDHREAAHRTLLQLSRVEAAFPGSTEVPKLLAELAASSPPSE